MVVQMTTHTRSQRRFDRSIRLVQVKSWCALLVLIGSVTAGLADRGNDLRSEIALRVALLTAPGHDPRRPTNVIASWAATLDHALGADCLAASAHNRPSAGAAPSEHTQSGVRH